MNEQYYGKLCLALYVFFVHKIMLQFCVFSINLPPALLVLFPHELLLVCVHNPIMGRTRLRYLRSTWGPMISLLLGDPPYQIATPWNN
jgi:hypothetical protein